MAPHPGPDDHSRARLLAGCDDEQQVAITSSGAPLCVLAAAGSGKTRVLTRRIAWRVLEGSATARYVLALTFTRKAAAELRGRLSRLGLPEPVTTGTFHAIALAELRRLAAERSRPAPVVAASKASLLVAALGKDARPSRPLLADLASELEWAMARCLSPRTYAAASRLAGRRPPIDATDLAELFARYEREKHRRGVLDFDDLLARCREELEGDPDFAASARWRYRHLFVDEYQDVNAAQERLLQAWLGPSRDLCVVGDPDQAIYGWNGSDPSVLETFKDRHRDATLVRLSTNYRSTRPILAVASSVLDAGAGPVEPRVRAAIWRSSGTIPTLSCFASDGEETGEVVARLRRSRAVGGSWSELAVLARTNAQLEAFETELSAVGVAYRSGGGRALLGRAPVRSALSDLASRHGQSGLRAWLDDLESTLDGHEGTAADDRQELLRLGYEFVSSDASATGEGFVAWLEASLRSDPPSGAKDAVDLLTFHRAKGLEWRVVFVTGLEDGLVPIAHAHSEEALAEERRLLYVACTRAREELHCSWAEQRSFAGRVVGRTPSPYLGAIQATALELARSGTMTPERTLAARDTVRAILAGRDRSSTD